MKIYDTSDDWGTPRQLYDGLIGKYSIFPQLDVAASYETRKCKSYFTKEFNALINDWILRETPTNTTIKREITSKVDVWCNPPHTLTKEFVEKAYEQWLKFNINIMMIIPANSMCTKYAEKCIGNFTEYHPIYGRPQFLKEGKVSDYPSRNSYFVVIWRKK